MKLSEIKTREQFWNVGDVWYQRTLNLASAWQDSTKNKEYRLKAYFLWCHYKNLTLKMTLIASKLNHHNLSYPSGGFINR